MPRRSDLKLIWLLSAAVVTALPFPATASTENTVEISNKSSNTKITGLQWDTERPEIQVSGTDDLQQAIAVVKGRFEHSSWKLILPNGKEIQTSEDGKFQIRLQIHGKESAIILTAMGPAGAKETEKLTVFYSNFEKKSASSESPAPPPKSKDYLVTAGLGPTWISYQQTRVSDLSETLLSAKAALVFYGQFFGISSRWEFATSAFGTVWTVNATPPALGIEFLGINLRAGYSFTAPEAPLKFQLTGGAYYTTMISPSGQLGIQNLVAPQLMPLVRYTMSPKTAVSAYVKYSPIMANLGSFSFSNRELAIGGALTYILPNYHPLSLAIDVASFHFAQPLVTIDSTSTSLGLGYGF